MTVSAEHVALARKGAIWCGWVRSTDGTWSFPTVAAFATDEQMLTAYGDALFVALLDKCGRPIGPGVLWYIVTIQQDDRETRVSIRISGSFYEAGAGRHPNRTIAMLLALDAARPDGWPEEEG